MKSIKEKQPSQLFNYIDIKEIKNPDKKSKICETILRALPEWFGIEEAIQEYSNGVKNQYFITAQVGNNPIGFISIKEHNHFTSEIYVLGILKEFHKQGIGRKFIKLTKEKLYKEEKKFLTVKTLSGSNPDENYKKTRKFYKAMDFYPLEEMTDLWNEENPCLYMVMPIKEVSP